MTKEIQTCRLAVYRWSISVQLIRVRDILRSDDALLIDDMT